MPSAAEVLFLLSGAKFTHNIEILLVTIKIFANFFTSNMKLPLRMCFALFLGIRWSKANSNTIGNDCFCRHGISQIINDQTQLDETVEGSGSPSCGTNSNACRSSDCAPSTSASIASVYSLSGQGKYKNDIIGQGSYEILSLKCKKCHLPVSYGKIIRFMKREIVGGSLNKKADQFIRKIIRTLPNEYLLFSLNFEKHNLEVFKGYCEKIQAPNCSGNEGKIKNRNMHDDKMEDLIAIIQDILNDWGFKTLKESARLPRNEMIKYFYTKSQNFLEIKNSRNFAGVNHHRDACNGASDQNGGDPVDGMNSLEKEEQLFDNPAVMADMLQATTELYISEAVNFPALKIFIYSRFLLALDAADCSGGRHITNLLFKMADNHEELDHPAFIYIMQNLRYNDADKKLFELHFVQAVFKFETFDDRRIKDLCKEFAYENKMFVAIPNDFIIKCIRILKKLYKEFQEKPNHFRHTDNSFTSDARKDAMSKGAANEPMDKERYYENLKDEHRLMTHNFVKIVSETLKNLCQSTSITTLAELANFYELVKDTNCLKQLKGSASILLKARLEEKTLLEALTEINPRFILNEEGIYKYIFKYCKNSNPIKSVFLDSLSKARYFVPKMIIIHCMFVFGYLTPSTNDELYNEIGSLKTSYFAEYMMGFIFQILRILSPGNDNANSSLNDGPMPRSFALGSSADNKIENLQWYLNAYIACFKRFSQKLDDLKNRIDGSPIEACFFYLHSYMCLVLKTNKIVVEAINSVPMNMNGFPAPASVAMSMNGHTRIAGKCNKGIASPRVLYKVSIFKQSCANNHQISSSIQFTQPPPPCNFYHIGATPYNSLLNKSVAFNKSVTFNKSVAFNKNVAYQNLPSGSVLPAYPNLLNGNIPPPYPSSLNGNVPPAYQNPPSGNVSLSYQNSLIDNLPPSYPIGNLPPPYPNSPNGRFPMNAGLAFNGNIPTFGIDHICKINGIDALEIPVNTLIDIIRMSNTAKNTILEHHLCEMLKFVIKEFIDDRLGNPNKTTSYAFIYADKVVMHLLKGKTELLDIFDNYFDGNEIFSRVLTINYLNLIFFEMYNRKYANISHDTPSNNAEIIRKASSTAKKTLETFKSRTFSRFNNLETMESFRMYILDFLECLDACNLPISVSTLNLDAIGKIKEMLVKVFARYLSKFHPGWKKMGNAAGSCAGTTDGHNYNATGRNNHSNVGKCSDSKSNMFMAPINLEDARHLERMYLVAFQELFPLHEIKEARNLSRNLKNLSDLGETGYLKL